MIGLLDFSNKTVVITGAATGIGAETLRLLQQHNAAVHTVDVAPLRFDRADRQLTNQPAIRAHRCDVGSKAEIDTLTTELPDSIDVLMNCAGVPNGGRYSSEEVMAINWFGLRHLTETLLPRIPNGGSVVHIASTAGRDWHKRVEVHQQLMNATSFDDGLNWLRQHSDLCGDGYVLSKEAVQYYTHWRSVQLLPTGVRMNSVCPGVTDTRLLSDFRAGMGDETIDHARAVAGRAAAPEEVAPTMLFLACNRAASYINGVNLNVDRGTAAARFSSQSDPELIWGSQAQT